MLFLVLSTDVSVVGHMLKGGRGALFRIPANAMQLKGHTHRSAAKGGSTSWKVEREKKAVVPLKCGAL